MTPLIDGDMLRYEVGAMCQDDDDIPYHFDRVIQMLEKKIEENLRKAFPPIETAVEWKRSHIVRNLDSIAIRSDQTQKDRPGYRVPQVEGLFLVGDSTGAPGAAMEMEYESVLACYDRISKEREG